MNKNLSVYEGNEPYIFVSYNHKDSERVFTIIEMLEKLGFRIWFDDGIEWGTEWPEFIENKLENAKLVLFFVSNTSVQSSNCLQEITLAQDEKIPVLPIYLEKTELVKGLKLKLSTSQSTFLYKFSNEKDFYKRLASLPLMNTCKVQLDHNDISSEKLEDTETGNVNIDHLIDKEFANQSVGEQSGNTSKQSELEEKMDKIVMKNYVKNLKESEGKNDNEESSDTESLFYEGLIPKEEHFTLVDTPNSKTVVLQVKKVADYQTLSRYYELEMLETAVKTDKKGQPITAYYVKASAEIIRVYIVLTFGESGFFTNFAVVKGSEIEITRKPKFTKYKEKKEKIEELDFSETLYDLSEFSAEDRKKVQEKKQGKKKYVAANIKDVHYYLFDLETYELIKREIFKDENDELKARMKIMPNRRYVACQINSASTGKRERPLTEHEKGLYYKTGEFSFPKDIFKAVSCFEKDGAPESLYEIAMIFKRDAVLRDKNSYLEYLKRAVEKRSCEAAVEMIWEIGNSNIQWDLNELEDIIVERETAFGLFMLGYFYETGIGFGKDLDKSFAYYSQAGEQSYIPAKARLKAGNKLDSTIADCCAGAVYFFGYGVEEQQEKALEILGNRTDVIEAFQEAREQ